MAKNRRNHLPSAGDTELGKLSDEKLIRLRARIDTEIRKRGLKFSVGEIGESLAIAHFNATKNLPKLLRAPRGTKNVDALSREGERYSIKTVMDAKKTGTIYPDATERDKQLFEHLLIVRLSQALEVEAIYRLSWDQFVQVRQWDRRMNAWYVGISRKSLAVGQAIVTVSPLLDIPDERSATETPLEHKDTSHVEHDAMGQA
ncbi:MAG TPA: hypothetical protein VHX86_06290 [Tepidisphaeraceae bacterium]|jgi:hypothetical protein|nr:hypothetical protein [Tepidisphaeraceae bacterium]